MKKEKKPSKPNIGYLHLILIYVAFCLVVLLVTAGMLSRYLIRNNTVQINNILSLMSEKVNTSFEMMTDYIIEASDLFSAQEEVDYAENYRQLLQTVPDMPYFSAGIIDSDGTVYGAPGEQMDIEKQGFALAVQEAGDVYISEPYRSSVTASNMITILAPIYHDGESAGSIYVTYYLETIQNLAYTNILSEETAVFLMNPYSGNFVNCSDDGTHPPGTWNNVRLIKKDITCMDGYDYDKWLSDMSVGSEDNIINFRQDGRAYTQAFVHIHGMDNWSLVIRIPITELSGTMQQFTVNVIICAALLVLATLLLAIILYRREHSKSEILKDLSDRDPLTKIMNRRGFNETMTKMFADKASIGRSTFMFLDLDFFKDVNDTYGHASGDYVLCAAAAILEKTFRDIGIVARVGGDEFNVFVTEPLSVEDMDTLLAGLRMEFHEITLPKEKEPLGISFSAGLAVYPQDSKDLKKLIECADKALYNVKQNGRKNHYWYADLK